MGFNVRFDDLREVYEFTRKKFSAWNDNITNIQSGINKVTGLSSFKGETAESVKAYYSEVHGWLSYAVCMAMSDFAQKYMLYMNGYYEIDSDIHAKLDEDTLNRAKQQYLTSVDNITEIKTELINALNSVSDIFSMGTPSTYALLDNHGEAIVKIQDAVTKVPPYDSAHLSGATAQLEELILNTRKCIQSYKSNRNIASNYVSCDYMKNEDMYALYVSMQASAKYQKDNKDALQEAIAQTEKVYQQLQAELAAMRADQGTAQVITGVIIGIVGIAAIIASGGIATPAVAALAVTAGGCTAVYGISETIEGGQDVYYGVKGDSYTSAWNPVRDTIFMGDQDAYSIWGNTSMFVASICIPVGKAMNGMKGMQAVKAGTIAGGKYMGKETVENLSDKYLFNPMVDVIAEKTGIESETGKLLIKLGVDAAKDPIADRIENKIDNSIESAKVKYDAEKTGEGFAGLMDDVESERYKSGKTDSIEVEIKEIQRDAEATEKGLSGLMDENDQKRLDEWYNSQEKPEKIVEIEREEAKQENQKKMGRIYKEAEEIVEKKPDGAYENSYNEIGETPFEEVLNDLEGMKE